jgi:hypothetical protein
MRLLNNINRKLWEQTDGELATFGFFSKDLNTNKILKKQGGVMRTNCKDNLDRTNLVQHNFAQKVGCEQLVQNVNEEQRDLVQDG